MAVCAVSVAAALHLRREMMGGAPGVRPGAPPAFRTWASGFGRGMRAVWLEGNRER